MKKYLQQKLMKLFILMTILTGLFSFTCFAGGDVYEIYLNDKLVYKQEYKQVSGSNNLHLGKLNMNDRLVIKYSHCGVPGQDRSIVIKDENGNIIKEWKFTNTQNNQSVMLIPVKELLDLKTKDASLKLYYAAKQLPGGRMLAAITLDEKKVAMNAVTEERTVLCPEVDPDGRKDEKHRDDAVSPG